MYLRSIPLKVHETRMLYRIVAEGDKKHHIQNGCALGGPSPLTPVINMPIISLRARFLVKCPIGSHGPRLP